MGKKIEANKYQHKQYWGTTIGTSPQNMSNSSGNAISTKIEEKIEAIHSDSSIFYRFVLISCLCLFLGKMIMSENVADKVKKIIADKLGVDIAKVTDEARFVDDFGADSLDTVDLVMALEEEFNIEISNKEGQEIQSVKDAISFIENKCGK